MIIWWYNTSNHNKNKLPARHKTR